MKKEEEEISQRLSDDRKDLIEATIVRIMKSRKSCIHNDLISEVMKITSEIFNPTASIIKSRVENLIEKEYIRRSDHDRTVYDYIS